MLVKAAHRRNHERVAGHIQTLAEFFGRRGAQLIQAFRPLFLILVAFGAMKIESFGKFLGKIRPAIGDALFPK